MVTNHTKKKKSCEWVFCLFSTLLDMDSDFFIAWDHIQLFFSSLCVPVVVVNSLNLSTLSALIKKMKYATGGQSATEACLNHNFSSCAAITFHNGGISTLSRLDYGQA